MKKTVLVIGSGGREHAIVDALNRSSQVDKIFCAPGNAGIAALATCIAIKETDVDALLAFAEENKVDLTVVGPEAPLSIGIVDRFRDAGQVIFGHTAAAARIESSKEFAKQIMARANIPTAAYEVFTDFHGALDYVSTRPFPTVIKYDGLAAGKGVVIAQDFAEAEAALTNMLLNSKFGQGKVVIEDYLTGPEFSFMAFVSRTDVFPMPLAQDHKRAFDGDCGPNTGGMGAYTPLPFVSNEEYQWALDNILCRVSCEMDVEGCPLSGVLYGGLMKTISGIKVIEFNARFGDPETEVLLPLLASDAYNIFSKIALGEPLKPVEITWRKASVIGVVMASKGYPNSYEKGYTIHGVNDFSGQVYHMGTKLVGDELQTAGGRVLMVVEEGETLLDVKEKLYNEITSIRCQNLFYRCDIAHQALPSKL